MGNDLKKQNHRVQWKSTYPLKRQKPTVMECPRYELVNALDTKYCSKYSYPLTPEAFDQIKQGNEEKFKELEKKLIQDMENK
jgi:hypothetical protein